MLEVAGCPAVHSMIPVRSLRATMGRRARSDALVQPCLTAHHWLGHPFEAAACMGLPCQHPGDCAAHACGVSSCCSPLRLPPGMGKRGLMSMRPGKRARAASCGAGGMHGMSASMMVQGTSNQQWHTQSWTVAWLPATAPSMAIHKLRVSSACPATPGLCIQTQAVQCASSLRYWAVCCQAGSR